LGYAGGNNYGAHFAKGDYLAFLNNDAYPEAEWLSSIIPLFSLDPSVAIVGCKIYKAGSAVLDSAGAYIDFPTGFAPCRGVGLPGTLYKKIEESAYVSGAAMVVKKKVFEQLGGFDADYFCYHEEVDFCWRARLLNHKILYAPSAIVHHEVSNTLGELSPTKEYLIERNRITTNLKNLEMINLIYALFYETVYTLGKIILFARLGKKQIIAPYARALAAILKNFGTIWTKRQHIQNIRKSSDKHVLSLHRRKSVVEYIRSAKLIYLNNATSPTTHTRAFRNCQNQIRPPS
jgi:GT2 family glycosyltransferase